MWPRRSWLRSTQYFVKRVLRLTASPHAVAAGVAAGVFASFTPFIGFHFAIAFAVSYVVAGNLIAAAAGTFFGNPITFPFIWASTYSTGRFILSGATTTATGTAHQRLGEIAHSDLIELGIAGLIHKIDAMWEPVIKPMAVGSIPIGTMVAIIFYLVTRWAAIKFRQTRLKRLSERAQERSSVPPKAGRADTVA